MKQKLFIAFLFLLALFAGCNQTGQPQQKSAEEPQNSATGAFGEATDPEGSTPAGAVAELFGDSDSVQVKLTGHITASCKHSGCWMDLDMGGQKTIHITFKDDAFTIPLDAAGKHAVVKGMAYREMIPVETLQNYAREEGMSEEEVLTITEPEWEYGLVATGVLIQE